MLFPQINERIKMNFEFNKIEKSYHGTKRTDNSIGVIKHHLVISGKAAEILGVRGGDSVELQYDAVNQAIKVSPTPNGLGWRLVRQESAGSQLYTSNAGLIRRGALQGEYSPVEGYPGVYKLSQVRSK